MGYVVREGRAGDMGGGHKPGNNWHKFTKEDHGKRFHHAIENKTKYGKDGHKKDANEKKRKPNTTGGMINRDGERQD